MNTVVMDRDDMRRTLMRIAHEIVEKNPGGQVAIVGIHRRGAVLAERVHALTSELLDSEVPLGSVDISFYRDDLAIRPGAPVVHATQLEFSVAGRTIVIVDDVLYTGRTVRAAIDEIFDYGRPGTGAARGAGRPGPPRAPDPARLHRQEHPDLPGRARQRARGGGRRPRRGHDRAGTRTEAGGGMSHIGRHLISIDDLDRQGIERILDRADSFEEVSGREIKKVPALRGRTVVNLFYEASTRTSSSFELAAKRLSADVVNIRSVGSSVDKGESLKDTVQTLSAYDPSAIVIRSPQVGAARLVAGWTTAAVINAGDGKHEHPTQALLDVLHAAPPAGVARRREHLDRRRRPALACGPFEHPGAQRMGARVTACGPPTLIPREIEALGCERRRTLERLARGRRGLRAADAAGADAATRSSRRCASTPSATRSTPRG